MVSFILSGGSGTRLWPLSREALPKQFSPLFEESLFAMTARRLLPFGSVSVCTGIGFQGLTEASARNENFPLETCLYEPCAKNTAPAVALICKVLKDAGRENEVVGIFPADHWIGKEDVFRQAIQLATECAQDGEIVTLGIKPDRPATGFGYVEVLDSIVRSGEDCQAQAVKAFHEKPNLDTAQNYVQAGNYFWNSGMFVFSVKTMIQSFQAFMPNMWLEMETLKPDLSNLSEVYNRLPSQSLDYGVMEHAQNQICIPCDPGWSDLGSWDDIHSFSEHLSPDCNKAKPFALDASNNFAFAIEPKAICFLGVENLQVVSTPDAIYIGQAGRSQEIKNLLTEVKKSNPELAKTHTFERRPWGEYKSLFEDKICKVKVITVDPKQQLSYQSHQKRSEIWVVICGTGEVVLDDKILKVSPGSIVEVPCRAKHRMRNTGTVELRFVEVQQGDYFGEDDITRYQDDYNRVPK